MADFVWQGAGNGGPSAMVSHYPNGSVLLESSGSCYCEDWYTSRGNHVEHSLSNACDWFAFAISVIFLVYYAWAAFNSSVGWEEIYVCTVELIKVSIDQFLSSNSPCTLYLSTGNRVLWIRYGEWLLTCPVILIHLSNVTGLKDNYSKRTMALLVSDIGTIVFGVTSAMCTGYPKVIFFILGCCYGANTFFNAAKVYLEAHHTLPKGSCRTLIRLMAYTYYASWGMFPILFVLGPESFGHMNMYQSNIAHTVIDLMSKNIWGMLGHFLRHKIREHILIHGDLRTTTTVNVAGEEMQVETMVAAEDADETTV
nr:NsChR [synthetic construct]